MSSLSPDPAEPTANHATQPPANRAHGPPGPCPRCHKAWCTFAHGLRRFQAHQASPLRYRPAQAPRSQLNQQAPLSQGGGGHAQAQPAPAQAQSTQRGF